MFLSVLVRLHREQETYIHGTAPLNYLLYQLEFRKAVSFFQWSSSCFVET